MLLSLTSEEMFALQILLFVLFDFYFTPFHASHGW